MIKQASSRYCFVCGVRNDHGLKLGFYIEEPGTVFSNFTICEGHQGYPGIAHGGVVAAILDEVAGRTFMNGNPPRFMVTAAMSVRYRKPVPIGKPLKAIGRSIEDNGRVAKAISQLFGPGDILLAEAEVLLANIPPEITGSVKVTPDDWRIYGDNEEMG